MRRLTVSMLEATDEALDAVLYRPAVVKAFIWMPRWWRCDLAKLATRLDDRWDTRVLPRDGRPGRLCEACKRRAAWTEISVLGPDTDDPDAAWRSAGRVIALCRWCKVTGPILNAMDLDRELRLARERSVAWRWRWPVRT